MSAATMTLILTQTGGPWVPSVGSDVMCVTLPRPGLSRIVQVRFVPSPVPNGGTAFNQAYKPWVVAPDVVVSPMIHTGGGFNEVPSGPFTFRFEGPPGTRVEEDGRIYLFRTQPRRNDPLSPPR
jgi:hypothetical protein